MPTPLSSKLPWETANPLWAQVLNPFINGPLNNIQIISNYQFLMGTNIISHKLGRLMIGWFLIDPQGVTSVYRSAPLNSLTITLTSSADFTSSIGVF
ncbi:MAG TPA: hypothetical protein VGF75_06775 [Candidatus Saccharimonadales bacterium]|jgi:hypothetical protein